MLREFKYMTAGCNKKSPVLRLHEELKLNPNWKAEAREEVARAGRGGHASEGSLHSEPVPEEHSWTSRHGVAVTVSLSVGIVAIGEFGPHVTADTRDEKRNTET